MSDSVWYCEQYRKIQSKSLRSFVASEFFGFRFAVSFVITLLSQSGEEGRRRKEEGAEAERRKKEWKRQHGRRDRYLVYCPAGVFLLILVKNEAVFSFFKEYLSPYIFEKESLFESLKVMNEMGRKAFRHIDAVFS